MGPDDYLTNDTPETVARGEARIAGKPGFCGLVGNQGSSPTGTANTPLGIPFRDDYVFPAIPSTQARSQTACGLVSGIRKFTANTKSPNLREKTS